MGRCGLDDAGWREVLERAPRVTAVELPGAAGDMAVEVVRLVRRGHDAGARWWPSGARAGGGVRPLVEPDAAALGRASRPSSRGSKGRRISPRRWRGWTSSRRGSGRRR
jgi:hypothetical protein